MEADSFGGQRRKGTLKPGRLEARVDVNIMCSLVPHRLIFCIVNCEDHILPRRNEPAGLIRRKSIVAEGGTSVLLCFQPSNH